MQKDIFQKLQAEGRCYVIAEAGLNHNGSLELAKKLIDVAAIAGADAVKFQKRTVDKLAVREALDAKDERFPEFGDTYRKIREHIEFDRDEYVQLMAYCEEKGLDFLCTAFDHDALAFLEDLGVQGYKLASHSLTNVPLLQDVAKVGKPVILSTGMAEWEEIDRAVEIFKNAGTPLALLHCVSAYPTPLEDENLRMMQSLRQRYDLPVGYSGHELGYQPTIIAAALGACIVERHYTLDKTMVGFDHKISLEPDEFIAMTRAIRSIPVMLGTGEKKVSNTEMITRHKYHVSMVSARALKNGETLSEEMITWKNPGTGIPPKKAGEYLGRPLSQDVDEDVLMTPEMFG